MKILISAAEASSDVHGAQLLKALKKLGVVEAYGVGGPALRAEGLKAVIHSEQMLVMGFLEILSRLPKIYLALKKIERLAKKQKPDVVVVMDYPDFHFRLAKRLKRYGVPVIYYIPPKVWAWRTKRLVQMKSLFRKVLCIFPFEEGIYTKSGLEASYVGNPLFDELPLGLSRAQARDQLGLSSEHTIITMMPGSRPAELKHHFPLMLESLELLVQKIEKPIQVLIPLPQTEEVEKFQEVLSAQNKSPLLQYKISRGDSGLCLKASDIGLIKSGTSTLEAALLECPHVVVYKNTPMTEWFFRKLVKFQGPVALSNLMLLDDPRDSKHPDPRVTSIDLGPTRMFKEFLGSLAQANLIADELYSLLKDEQRRSEMRQAFLNLKNKMRSESPSAQAAKNIFNFVHDQKKQILYTDPPSSVFIGLASFLWSLTNSLRDYFIKITPKPIPARVVSVGNLQAGGSGKTPLVAEIARESIERGLKTAILTRGYKSKWEQSGGLVRPGSERVDSAMAGDEVSLLHDLVPQAWIGVGKNRVKQYEKLVKEAGFDFDIVILDDGFQYKKIKKDVEILTLTSLSPCQTVFRDFFSKASQADLKIWTKGVFPPPFLHAPDVKIKYDLQLDDKLKGTPVWLVTGVGDPESVRAVVEQAGLKVEKHLAYSDHIHYHSQAIQKITREAIRKNCKIALTGKDWVKWRESVLTRENIIILEPHLLFEQGKEKWSKVLWGE